MKKSATDFFEELFVRVPALAENRQDIEQAFEILVHCYKSGGKVLVCGNGGSAADSEHIVGELMKGFMLMRPISEKDREWLKAHFPDGYEYLADNLQGALPAISLVSHTALSTAFINDIAGDMVFAQQVYGYAKEGDVLIGISTSGNSKNVVYAIKVAKAFGMKTIGLTGSSGGTMKTLCDAAICVPEIETFKVQEYHLPIYHALCAMLESEFFG